MNLGLGDMFEPHSTHLQYVTLERCSPSSYHNLESKKEIPETLNPPAFTWNEHGLTCTCLLDPQKDCLAKLEDSDLWPVIIPNRF